MSKAPPAEPESSGETRQTNLTVRADIWAAVSKIASMENISKSAIVEQALLDDARVAMELKLEVRRG
jgi:predicted transcriptional regulator